MTTEPAPAPELLALLRCPLTRQPLRRLTADEAATLGWAQGGLVRTDGSFAYPIDEHGLPRLLPDEGKPLPSSAP